MNETPKALRVLVACEFSGVMRDAFSDRGWEAWSCDLLPSETPGLHYQGDVRYLLDGWVPVRHQCECDPDGDGWCKLTGSIGPTQDGVEYLETENGLFGRLEDHPHWDLMLAFPPCTYLCSSGMHWTVRGKRDPQHTEDALDFVRLLLGANVKHIALENPVGAISTRIRKPDCVIHPWQFGESASKTTCLWLKNLPALVPTNILPKPASGRWDNQTPSGQNKLGPSKDRWKLRSATYPGIARAASLQWSDYIKSGRETELFVNMR